MSNRKMRDEQMIFLISLPRSGSTMLQKIIGGHSDIYTRSEPWIMLHPLFALKNEGIKTRYNAKLASDAVTSFISELPSNNPNLYYESIRDCYLPLYEAYLQSSDKCYFLDKTPRYYEIFDELQKTFPKAKFIILYRNPLAVLSSILDTWIKGDWELLKNYKVDLEQGVEFLGRDFSMYENTHTIQYEQLLQNSELEVKALFEFLALEYQPECLSYGNEKQEKWLHGDPETVYIKSEPDALHINQWHETLSSPEHYQLIKDYLEIIGTEKFNKLGYNFATNISLLEKAKNSFKHPDNHELKLEKYLLNDTQIIHRTRNQLEQLKNNLKIEIKNKQIIEKSLEKTSKELADKNSEIMQIKNELLNIKNISIIRNPYKKMIAYKTFLNNYVEISK